MSTLKIKTLKELVLLMSGSFFLDNKYCASDTLPTIVSLMYVPHLPSYLWVEEGKLWVAAHVIIICVVVTKSAMNFT